MSNWIIENRQSDYYGIGYTTLDLDEMPIASLEDASFTSCQEVRQMTLQDGSIAEKSGRIRIDGKCTIENTLKTPHEAPLNKKNPEQRLIFKITGLFQKDGSNERYNKPFIDGVTIDNILSCSEFIASFKRGNPLYFRA